MGILDGLSEKTGTSIHNPFRLHRGRFPHNPPTFISVLWGTSPRSKGTAACSLEQVTRSHLMSRKTRNKQRQQIVSFVRQMQENEQDETEGISLTAFKVLCATAQILLTKIVS